MKLKQLTWQIGPNWGVRRGLGYLLGLVVLVGLMPGCGQSQTNGTSAQSPEGAGSSVVAANGSAQPAQPAKASATTQPVQASATTQPAANSDMKVYVSAATAGHVMVTGTSTLHDWTVKGGADPGRRALRARPGTTALGAEVRRPHHSGHVAEEHRRRGDGQHDV